MNYAVRWSILDTTDAPQERVGCLLERKQQLGLDPQQMVSWNRATPSDWQAKATPISVPEPIPRLAVLMAGRG